MVNFYRDMWRMRSHVLAPLSALVSPKVKFEWRKEHQDAFEQFKTIISKETLLTFPNYFFGILGILGKGPPVLNTT
jgi:hypothetical protein